jgi:hypothetical protein
MSLPSPSELHAPSISFFSILSPALVTTVTLFYPANFGRTGGCSRCTDQTDLNGPGFTVRAGARNFLVSAKRPNRLRGLSSLLFNGCRFSSAPGGQAAGGVNLTACRKLVSEVENKWNYTSSPPICLYLLSKHLFFISTIYND